MAPWHRASSQQQPAGAGLPAAPRLGPRVGGAVCRRVSEAFGLGEHFERQLTVFLPLRLISEIQISTTELLSIDFFFNLNASDT